jgi:elongation factor 1-gamma
MALKLYTYMPNYRAWKTLIAAAYNDIKIDVPPFELHKDNVTPEFLAKNPLGKVPVLETPHGCIFESNAIARYVTRLRQDTDLCGCGFFESSQVDQWIDFSANELEPTRAIWLFPLSGFLQYDAEAYQSAKQDVAKTLGVLNQHLESRTYLVGEKITLADIVIVSALVELYRRVFDPEFRKPFGNVNRWFLTCVNQPQFSRVIGKVDLCEKEEVAAGQQAGGKKDKKHEKQQKQQGGKQEKQKKQAKKKDTAEEEDENFEEKKGPNPLDLLPKSPMVLDAVKKLFFEKRPDFAGFFKEFWGFFDAQGYSIYTLDYIYNAENTIYFMTCNLASGFIQRLDDLRKYAFGVVNVLGQAETAPPFFVNACFIFRGTDVPAEMKECPDAEYYTFTKLDASNSADQKKVEDRFYADTVDRLTVLERKYFK